METCDNCKARPVDVACVDLCMYLCAPCYDAFDVWERTKAKGALFASWPGLLVPS